MNEHYEKLLQNLNVVIYELKSRDDLTLNLCVKYLKNAKLEAGRLYADLNAEQSNDSN